MPLEELELLEALEELEKLELLEALEELEKLELLETLELLEELETLEPTRENRSLSFEAGNALSQIGICQDKSSH